MLFVSSMLSARFNCSLRFSSCTILLGLLFTVSLEHLQSLLQAWLTRLSLDGLAHRNLGRSSEISLNMPTAALVQPLYTFVYFRQHPSFLPQSGSN